MLCVFSYLAAGQDKKKVPQIYNMQKPQNVSTTKQSIVVQQEQIKPSQQAKLIPQQTPRQEPFVLENSTSNKPDNAQVKQPQSEPSNDVQKSVEQSLPAVPPRLHSQKSIPQVRGPPPVIPPRSSPQQRKASLENALRNASNPIRQYGPSTAQVATSTFLFIFKYMHCVRVLVYEQVDVKFACSG